MRTRFRIFVVVGVVCAAAVALGAGIRTAFADVAPPWSTGYSDRTSSPYNFYSPNGDVVWAEVSQPGPGDSLDAPEDDINLYFPASQGPVQAADLINPDDCHYSTSGNYIDQDPGGSALNNTTVFDFNVPATRTTLGSYTSVIDGAGCHSADNVAIPLNLSSVPVQHYSTGDYYVVTLAAVAQPGSQGVNAFRVDVPGGYSDYTSASPIYTPGAGPKFALQERDSAPANAQTQFDLYFSPPCSGAATQAGTLSWFNADWGSLQNNANYDWSLWDLTAGSEVAQMPGSSLGTNSLGAATYTFTRGHLYAWEWNGVYRDNGIQFQLPFDGFNAGQTCQQPPQTSGSATCTTLTVTADDPVDASDAVSVTASVDSSSGSYNVPMTAIGGDQFTGDLSNYEGIAGRTIYITASDGGGSTNATASMPANCASPTCNLVPVGAFESRGETFNFTATVDWSPYGGDGDPPAGPSTAPPPITIVFYNSTNGQKYGATPTGDPAATILGGGKMEESQDFSANLSVAGAYVVYEQLGGGYSCGNTCVPPSRVADCGPPNPFHVVNQPYLKVYGGDTMAGSGFASSVASDSCSGGGAPTVTSGAGTYAWNSTANYSGASTNAGAFAVALVDGYASANGIESPGSSVGAPRSLTFANNAGGTYGGNYGDATCVPDYYSELQSSQYATSAPSTIGAQTIEHARTVYLGTSNVTITGNVAFDPSATYSSPNDMPLFYVVVKGANIYIDPDVTELDGVYIAEPDSSGHGGNIYTCANYGSPNQLFDNCTHKLTVKGSFIAKDVHFLRTNGTLDQAAAPASTDNCSAVNATNANAAEVFCYLPSLWLVNPFPASNSKFDSISSLPPVL